jgi:hypothetical protein
MVTIQLGGHGIYLAPLFACLMLDNCTIMRPPVTSDHADDEMLNKAKICMDGKARVKQGKQDLLKLFFTSLIKLRLGSAQQAQRPHSFERRLLLVLLIIMTSASLPPTQVVCPEGPREEPGATEGDKHGVFRQTYSPTRQDFSCLCCRRRNSGFPSSS